MEMREGGEVKYSGLHKAFLGGKGYTDEWMALFFFPFSFCLACLEMGCFWENTVNGWVAAID